MTEICTSNGCVVKIESFDSIIHYENKSNIDLNWPCVFVLPSWIQTWYKNFGAPHQPKLLSILQGGNPIGLALLKEKDDLVSFMGSADVCDYLDFVISPGKETVFFSALIDFMVSTPVKGMELRCLRPDSLTTHFLIPYVKEMGFSVDCEPDGVSFEVDLPGAWDDYLLLLNAKQRHEVKRKFRRLYEAGDVLFDVYDDMYLRDDKIELFFKLFTESREDKSDFMTSRMDIFFREMFQVMSKANILKLGVMSIDHQPVAAILFFDFNDKFYLYNNGFDLNYRGLSVGLLCKVLAIEKAILSEKKVFDFLKGTEIYKTRLGGKEIQLSRCRILFP